jgi:hypothetical protein
LGGELSVGKMTDKYTLPEPSAHMFSMDLEKFQSNETFAHVYSVAVSSPDGSSEPLFTADQMQAAYAAGLETGRKVPEGWKLVPIEPTVEMRTAGSFSIDLHSNSPLGTWAAMAEAAPEYKP